MESIPPGTAEALRGYVAGVAGCPPERVTAAIRFDGGNRHSVYKVSVLAPGAATGHVVVRVALGGEPDDRIQAEREAAVLRRVGGVAAPLLYDISSRSRWFRTPCMCMQFIDGLTRDLRSSTPGQVELLGSVVAGFHSLSVEGLAAGAGPHDLSTYAGERLRATLSMVDWARGPLPATVRSRLRAAACSVRRRWKEDGDVLGPDGAEGLVLLHGDIAAGNVLWDPGPVLVDWEYARLGDPADEIAYLFDQNDLGPDQREAFWRGYLPALDRSRAQSRRMVERVGRWESLTLLGSALWWV